LICEGPPFILFFAIPDVPLSKREGEVLKLVLQGKGNKQIALALDISVRTVEFHFGAARWRGADGACARFPAQVLDHSRPLR
jgi:FixJ family two-component response regulator